MAEPMSDERLAQLAGRAELPCTCQDSDCGNYTSALTAEEARELLAEVKRLRDAVRLEREAFDIRGARVAQQRAELAAAWKERDAATTRAETAKRELAEMRKLTAGLRQHWGVQADHSQSAFPARTRELAEQLAAMYSRLREPGSRPTLHHVVTRLEGDWQRIEAEQQPEDGNRG